MTRKPSETARMTVTVEHIALRHALLQWLVIALVSIAAIFLAASQAGAQAPLQGLDEIFLDPDQIGSRAVQIFLLLTVLSLVPGIAVMVTCFPFIVTVLSILRQAIGLQQAPPNMLIVSLALFLTYYVMDPVLTAAWESGGRPLAAGEISLQEGFTRAMEPLRGFMANRVDPGTFTALDELRNPVDDATLPNNDPSDAGSASPTAALSILVPSFLLSEIARAFEIGFLIFLPFLIIDLVVAAILMSMGMMMVPPAIVALPFKLAFFVVADGWTLVATALVRSYS
jgi:flagellar biosynthetic protein FliP